MDPMNSSYRSLLPVFTLLAIAALPRGAGAQEISAFGMVAPSSNVEFPSPRGIGASVLKEVHGDWLVRLSYARIYDSTEKPGQVCVVYSPPIGCHTEDVSTSDSFSGLRFGIMRAVRLKSIARIGAGLGISMSSIHVEATGVSGQRADLERPLTAQTGYLAMLHVSVSPVPSLPFRITAGLQRHWVHFKSCADPPTYDPFCGIDTFREAEVGIAYKIG
ncbi:MAG: hypothetical protein LJF04_18360 [Gemmatimonadetes bacterium]|nr:hypothetical protein [Gemmatimonadota bacterium]